MTEIHSCTRYEVATDSPESNKYHQVIMRPIELQATNRHQLVSPTSAHLVGSMLYALCLVSGIVVVKSSCCTSSSINIVVLVVVK